MGQRRCCITDCKSASNLPECSEVKFHTFPTNVVLRELWIKNCRIDSSKSVTNSVFVCSRHFNEAEFQIPKNKKRSLKNGAVPTIFSWGNGISYSEFLAEAQAADKSVDSTSKDETNKTTRASTESALQNPKATTATSKKANTRTSKSSVNVDSLKPRSASADDQLSVDANAKVDKSPARKSLDSATISDKSVAKASDIKSPLKRIDSLSSLSAGSKVEVQDLNGTWHNARIMEVDQNDQEVFINFENSVKAKGSTSFKLNDEWIRMDSSRLRIPNQNPKKVETPAQFKVGDKCLARWTDSRKFPGTVHSVLENNMYEIIFDDGCVKIVKGVHISKHRKTASDKTHQQTANASLNEIKTPVTSPAPTPIVKKTLKINPIPKFDLSKFSLPEIPSDGEWCCPWINDTPIGEESFLVNSDGNKRPTVLVIDVRLPQGWTKHLYQRSSTSGKWDVVLVGPNNKRFRSKNDVKVYLEENGRSYNPDVYDFSIHKRRAKDLGVYVYTDDYVPPVIQKPSTSEYKLDSSFDSSLADFKQEPFTGFSPNESTSSILSKITQEIKYDASTPIKMEPQLTEDETGFTQVGSLKVQIIDNLYHCPIEGCKKNLRKENYFQIHVKHYHPDLFKQTGECPNMTELAYFRTKGTPAEEKFQKNKIPNAQFFEKVYQSEMRTSRKSLSPTHIKTEIKTEDASTPLASIPEMQSTDNLKRKLNLSHTAPEVKEKRKPTASDKILSPELQQKSSPSKDNLSSDAAMNPLNASTPLTSKKSDLIAVDAKSIAQKPQIPRFKIGNVGRIKGAAKVAKRKTSKGFKKKFKKLGRTPFKRKHTDIQTFEVVGSRPSIFLQNIDSSLYAGGNSNISSTVPMNASRRFKYLQYSTGKPNVDNLQIVERRGGYINENGELIKIVRMRQEEIINCLCLYPEEDGLMIQCELCYTWQHGGCSGIEKESEVPEKYVCYICRNPEGARESMKYIHDQDWLYEGKLAHANYHQTSRHATQRFDILKQSHTLTGNLFELKRSLHSLNVKINIATNKDHPKMYLWSKKWEQSPPRNTEASSNAKVKVEPKLEANESTSSDNKTTSDLKSNVDDQSQKIIENTESSGSQQKPDEGKPALKDEMANNVAGASTDEKDTKIELKEAIQQQQQQHVKTVSKKQAPTTPNIPEPEAAIDSAECQHRLLEHIQKEQNHILSRMQTIDAQIIALESMDDHPDANSKADFAKTSQTIRMLLRDLAKMRRLATINETAITYNPVDATQFL